MMGRELIFLLGFAFHALFWKYLVEDRLRNLLFNTGYICCRTVTASTGHNLRVFINGKEGSHVTAARIPCRAGRWGFLVWVDEIETFEDGSLATRNGKIVHRPRRYGFTKYEIVDGPDE